MHVPLRVGFLSVQNPSTYKPNEDYYVCNEASNIYIVCDGISRYCNKPELYPDPSPAAQASRIIANEVNEYLENHLSNTLSDPEIKDLLKQSIKNANRKLAQFNAQTFREFDFLENDRAGTCMILAVVVGNKLHFASIGDCIIQHVSDSEIFTMNKNQTTEAEAHFPEPHSKESLTKMKGFRNTKGAKYAFGALTGEDSALDFVEYGSKDIKQDDIVFLHSDGMQPFFDRFKAGQEHLDLNEIDKLAYNYTVELNQRLDDRTVIKIEITGTPNLLGCNA